MGTWARVGAANNAAWCDEVCRTHGITGTFATDAWTSATRTPALYPDAVTLAPITDVDAILRAVDRSPGASVKDSFSTLDLAPHGFEILFSAEWMARRPRATPPADAPGLRWSVVAADSGFGAWERAWQGESDSADVLRPALTASSAVTILRATTAARAGVVAGAIAFRTAGAVGISNVFTCGAALGDVWRSLGAWLDHRHPDVPAFGYEHGVDLDASRAAGFEPVGPLRVWVKPLG